jgi:integrase/recombinase XerD
MVALRDPESIGQASQILAIPLKRADCRVIKALSREEVEAIISAPDLSQWNGRRDHALLLALYNTGARVSEVISLQYRQVHIGGEHLSTSIRQRAGCFSATTSPTRFT